jgi:hypothetical protein
VHFDGGKTDDGWSPEHIGAGAAVVAIHVLLVWFVYIAFTEDVSDEAEGDDAIINLKNRIKQMEQAVADAEAEKKAQVSHACTFHSPFSCCHDVMCCFCAWLSFHSFQNQQQSTSLFGF